MMAKVRARTAATQNCVAASKQKLRNVRYYSENCRFESVHPDVSIEVGMMIA
jgi:hypothetical protein